MNEDIVKRRITDETLKNEVSDDDMLLLDSLSSGTSRIPAKPYIVSSTALKSALSSQSQLVAKLSNIVRFNLIDKFEVVYNAYYENVSGLLQVHHSNVATTYILKNPIRLLAGKAYERSYLYNAFCFFCERDTTNIITSVQGKPDPYIPENDVDLYLTIDGTNIDKAYLYEVFYNDTFNTDKTLSVDGMPSDAKTTGDFINNIYNAIKLIGSQTIPNQTSNTETVLTGISVDLKKKYKIVLKNNGTTAGYVNVSTQIDGSKTSSHATPLLSSNETVEITLLRFYGGNLAYTNNDICVRNINGISFDVSVYEYTDSDVGHPIEGQNGILIVNGSDNRANAEFQYVQDAVRYALNMYNGNDIVDIFIKEGTYTVTANQAYEPYCALNIGKTNNSLPVINLHGFNRDGVIIQMTNTDSMQGRIVDMGAPGQIVENITFKSLKGYTTFDSGKRPYCIHNDTSNDPDYQFMTTLKNCVLYTECDAPPIGAGLRHNQKQIYKDCVFIYSGEIEAIGVLYIHGPSRTGDVPVGVEVDGCTVISNNANTLVVSMSNVSGMVPYTEIPVTFRRTIVASVGEKLVPSGFKSSHAMTIDSALNNNSELNY